MSILPLSALQLQHKVSSERVSSGVLDLDAMLEGRGFFRGSSVLVTGTAGSGKTTLAASFVEAACRRGERVLYFAFEESPGQIMRNMRSIGIHLQPWVNDGLLAHEAWRPTQFGIEMHLLRIYKLVEKFKPQCVVIDPITNLLNGSSENEVYSMLMRLIDFLKSAGITAFFVSLTGGGNGLEQTTVGISSLTDTWILLRDIELSGERNRCIYVLKSRGMAHSNQLREFVMTKRGIKLIPAYIGTGGVLTGSSRVAQEAREKAEAVRSQIAFEREQEEIERKKIVLEAQAAALQAEIASVEKETKKITSETHEREQQSKRDRVTLARSRHASRTVRENRSIEGQ